MMQSSLIIVKDEHIVRVEQVPQPAKTLIMQINPLLLPHAAACLPAHRQLFYGGTWHAPLDGRYQDSINPATGLPIVAVAQAGVQDTGAAIQAAHAAFPGWKALTAAQRAACLRKAADTLRAHAEELAMVDAMDTGNPVAEMVGDAHAAAASLDYFAGLAPMIQGHTIPSGLGREECLQEMLDFTELKSVNIQL